MTEARAVALSILALLGAIAVAAPATAGGYTGTSGAAAVEAPAENNSSMGDQVSSFMHASSAGTDEEVHSGMWNAAYANASDDPGKRAVVEDRTGDIESRLDALEAEKEELIAAHENGSIGETEYRSRMSGVAGRIAALNRSIDETERQARATGANSSKVERLREQASNVSGPEVAAAARTMAGGPPEGIPGAPADPGPPESAGPPDGTEKPGNSGEQGSRGNESGQGPPDGAGEGPPGNGQSEGKNGKGGDGKRGKSGDVGNGNGGDGDAKAYNGAPVLAFPVRPF